MEEGKFVCPHCMAMLNPNKRLIFRVRFGNCNALMLLSPYLGDYESFCEQSFQDAVRDGDLVHFHCPVCGKALATSETDRLAEVLQIYPDRQPRRIKFSQVCGQHATFTIDGNEFEAIGEHADLFRNLNFSDTDRWW
jgi:hypothetical protein